MTQDATIERIAVVWDDEKKKFTEVRQTAEVRIDHAGGGLPAYNAGVKQATAWQIVRLHK